MSYINGFTNCNIYVEGKGIIKSDLKVVDGKVASFENKEGLQLDDNYIVVPGFIDRHIHGANGSDAMYATFEDLTNISKTIAAEGVTGFLPTTMTDDKGRIIKALNCMRDYMKEGIIEGAQVLGAHLEGPFISAKHKGAQPLEYILPCSVETFKEFQDASGDNIREVTFAYEENGSELCKYFKKNNICGSLGHTDATAADVLNAVKDGCNSATHTYNAMKGLHHREAGTVGGVMLNDEIYAELICDFVHVSREAIKVLYKVKGQDKITIVTDALECKHMPEGTYKLAGQEVFVKGKEARLASGTLAGSTLYMNDGVKNLKDLLGISLENAIDLASINPARALGLDNKKGSIALGKDADFAIIDKDLNVYMTVVCGKVVYKNL